jgi:hypothetical protein
MHIHKLALFTASLFITSCSNCDEGAEEPSTSFADICPEVLPPPQDCSIPEISQAQSKALTKVDEFRDRFTI